MRWLRGPHYLWADMVHPRPHPSRLRKLVTEFEPDAQEVPRILRMILLECVEEEEQGKEQEEPAAGCLEKRRSKSLSFVTLRSRLLGGALGGTCRPPEARLWPGEEDNGGGPHFSAGGTTRRVRSMPEMSPVEQTTQSWMGSAGEGGRVEVGAGSRYLWDHLGQSRMGRPGNIHSELGYSAMEHPDHANLLKNAHLHHIEGTTVYRQKYIPSRSSIGIQKHDLPI